MVEYVRGSKIDIWHWFKNCTQYPMYLYQKTSVEPPSNLCEQCKRLRKKEITDSWLQLACLGRFEVKQND